MIEGKVARILNSRELVVNRGSADGVTEGMRFEVLDPKADDVTDPDTGESLGSVYRPKVKIQAVLVENRMTICRTYERTGGRPGLGAADMARLFVGEPAHWITFRTDDALWEPIEESASYVKRGDPVREIAAEEE